MKLQGKLLVFFTVYVNLGMPAPNGVNGAYVVVQYSTWLNGGDVEA